MSLTRVILVDDFVPFRNWVRSVLQTRSGFQIICELSDGLEAVARTEKIQPDLVILDIGLPKLNGIEAARKIRSLSPCSKILFISVEKSPVIVAEALSLAASGYLLKFDAAKELMIAVDALMRGDRYISSSLAHCSDQRFPAFGGDEESKS